MQNDLVAFIAARTLRTPSISYVELGQEIDNQFGVPASCQTINVLRRTLRFKYQPPRQNQILATGYIVDCIAFWTNVLAMREGLRTINFADELRIVLCDDRG
jgi:hypothetical protein